MSSQSGTHSAHDGGGRTKAVNGSAAPGTSDSVPQDCLGCRVAGCLFGVGGAGYLGTVLLQEPPPRGAHRYALIVTAGTMFAFGMYRAFG